MPFLLAIPVPDEMLYFDIYFRFYNCWPDAGLMFTVYSFSPLNNNLHFSITKLKMFIIFIVKGESQFVCKCLAY